MTGAVRDLKKSYPDFEIWVESPCPEIWENNPYLTPLDKKDPEVEIYDIEYPAIHDSGWRGLHFSDAFREDIQNKLNSKCPNKIKIKMTSLLPDLHIAEIEKQWTNQVAMTFQYPGKFWILNAGSKPDNPLKQYPKESYQRMVDLLRDKVQFVQVGHVDHIHPELKGVYNLIGQTDLRQLIRLMYWAEGVVTPISLHMVMAAAFQKPCVVIAGGKEGPRWQMFPNHRFLHTVGAMPCCSYSGCWRSAYKDCTNRVGEVPRCFALIRPEDVARAVELYYLGGLLCYGGDIVHDWRDTHRASTCIR